MDINFCFSYILFHLSGQKHLTSSNKSIWCSLLYITLLHTSSEHTIHIPDKKSAMLSTGKNLWQQIMAWPLLGTGVCVCFVSLMVYVQCENFSVWDYVHTLRTGPVQDETAPLWKILTVPMRVDRIQICLWETKQALVSVCKFAFVCMCKWKRWSMTFNTRKTLEVQRSKSTTLLNIYWAVPWPIVIISWKLY